MVRSRAALLKHRSGAGLLEEFLDLIFTVAVTTALARLYTVVNRLENRVDEIEQREEQQE